ncbi:MAG: PAS domain-containing protein [Melioribacteraceae bacterium]|nr:PAS domain-containing protein [Melioribacteraceae bacterium]MCF8352963.1 PAS domain-containing protein [Melioribacteraceae bacterium]MCF8395830.1 PAS domain-containing protein [Melioribacteraceae bacterium]MCF8417480.1 PAS domain-containing protein [Melioribacteraceae bacterium]
MNLTLSKKIGVLITLIFSTIIIFSIIIFLNNEEDLLLDAAKSSTEETINLVAGSVTFAMGEGIVDVQPFINSALEAEKLVELRIIPTNEVIDGNESELDAEEKEVLRSGVNNFHEDEFDNKEVFRSIHLIKADQVCIECHDVNPGNAMAVLSARYSIADTYSAISSQRAAALLIGGFAILLTFVIISYVLKKQITLPLNLLLAGVNKIAAGEDYVEINVNAEGEFAVLADAMNSMSQKITQQIKYLEEIPTPIMIVDKEFNVKYMNGKGAEVLGRTKEDIYKSKCYDLFKTGHCNSNECRLKQAMETKKTQTGETIAKPNGKEVHIMYTGTPIRDKSGEVTGALEYVADVSNIKEVQNYLSESTHRMLTEMEKFAKGDLTVELIPEKDDEIGKLFLGFNKAVNNINAVVAKLINAVHTVSETSRKIAVSVEQMAAGSQEESSQIGEISASVEEMSATITSTSKSANDAAEFANTSGNIAKEGGGTVYESINGMNKIVETVAGASDKVSSLGESSKKIGEIISVIEEIADQTNLLALNAAIEAARAGNQGRGFAVVADEVRKLAERTTLATKEISNMIIEIQKGTDGAVESITESKNEVGKGKDLAERAGDSLKKIIDSATRVMDSINQVASASEEQSATAEQISRSIESISSVVSQTSEGIQQMVLATEDLNQLTDNLNTIVKSFRISDSNQSGYSVRSNGILIKKEV